MSDLQEPTALTQAQEAAEEIARQAAATLVQARAEARERATRFAGTTTESHIEAAQIRALADQVRLEDPATIEAAEIAVARAELDAVIARYAALEATGPALQDELDRLQDELDAATTARNAARMALSLTQPMFNGKNGEIGGARQRLTAAEQAARHGAEERLATLTGIRPGPATPGRNDLTQRTTTTW